MNYHSCFAVACLFITVTSPSSVYAQAPASMVVPNQSQTANVKPELIIELTPASSYTSANSHTGDTVEFQVVRDTVVGSYNGKPLTVPASGTVVNATVKHAVRHNYFRNGEIRVSATDFQSFDSMDKTIHFTVTFQPHKAARKGIDPHTIAEGTTNQTFYPAAIIAALAAGGAAFLNNSKTQDAIYGVAGLTLIGGVTSGNGIIGNDATIVAGNVYKVDVSGVVIDK